MGLLTPSMVEWAQSVKRGDDLGDETQETGTTLKEAPNVNTPLQDEAPLQQAPERGVHMKTEPVTGLTGVPQASIVGQLQGKAEETSPGGHGNNGTLS